MANKWYSALHSISGLVVIQLEYQIRLTIVGLKTDIVKKPFSKLMFTQ